MRKLNVPLILCFALLLVSTVQGQTTSGVNNAELNGAYALTFSGISGDTATKSCTKRGCELLALIEHGWRRSIWMYRPRDWVPGLFELPPLSLKPVAQSPR